MADAHRQNIFIVWAAVLSVFALALGVVVGVLRDEKVPAEPVVDDCVVSAPKEHSVARAWNEVLLAAVRLDVPSPTVHARNLFHTSAAMWDAWAAYDQTASGVYVDEQRTVEDVDKARDEAISYAAYRILVERYLLSPGAEESITGFDQLMADLCHDTSFTDITGDSGASLGNRIAEVILAETLEDGSNEADGYTDPTYEPANPPLVVAEPGAEMVDPNRWQPLELEVMVSQTGQPLDETVQTFVGPHWGRVTPFALAVPGDGSPALDPGQPPLLGEEATDQVFKDAAVEVVAYSAALDPTSGDSIDIGPASKGNAPLASYDEQGYSENPVTGERYEPNVVSLGDYGRVVAEFWADGPSSETPPGHWNSIANAVTDALGNELRIGGDGPVVGSLEWDVKLYLAINGAVHDAAVAAWGSKGYYDYARPISMIRFMGGLGQSSNPDGGSYHASGLPLEPGLVELVNEESVVAGERHAHLADHVGEIALFSWRGTPADPETDLGGVGWIRAVEWVPYQQPTFVTPAFAGYVSGHSAFSRAAAEVLAAITGDEFFPGGLGEWTVAPDSLEFESGPAQPVTLQWATYTDAADEAGRSRLFGGIHVWADDLLGRRIGSETGRGAWLLAQQYFDGTAAR